MGTELHGDLYDALRTHQPRPCSYLKPAQGLSCLDFLTNMEWTTSYGSCFALQKCLLLLCRNAPLLLVCFIIWKILKSFTVWHTASEWLQGSHKLPLVFQECLSKRSSITEWVHRRNGTSLQKTKSLRKVTIQKQLVGPQDISLQKPYQRVRQLLCKELACKLCECVAQEAWQLIYWQGADGCGCTTPRFLLSPLPCKEAKGPVPPGISVEEEHACPRCSRASSACLGHVHPAPEKAASSDATLHVASFLVRQKASKRTPQDQKAQGNFSGDQDVRMEDLSSFSSSTYDTSSLSTWTDSSGRSTAIFSRLRGYRCRKHHKSVRQKQKGCPGSPEQRSPGATRAEEMQFPSVPVPFVKEAMIQGLESHLVAKRLQHLLGVSWILLRSLRSFIPSAPLSSSGRHLQVTVVVRRPRALSFVAAKIKKRLELHLNKRVQLKHWQLPRRVQEALRRMGPPLLPKSEDSPAQKQGKRAKKTVAPVQQPLHRSLDVVQRKVELHLAKKCVEMQVEVFPAVALHSWRRARQLTRQPLPKLVSPGDKLLQPRLPFLPFVLSKDAQKMEMAVQQRHLSSFWGLAQRYIESLAAVAPPPSSSKPLRCRRAASEFSGAQTPFLQQWGRESLEAHVRKKRLQHEWGFPNVVQRSLKAFLQSVVPGSVRRKTKSHVETLPQELWFLPGETCTLLEFHLQRMKLQQRWGLPRRVLETCKLLFPELPYEEKKRLAVKPVSQQPSLGVKTRAGGLVKPRQGEKEARKRRGVELCPAQPLLWLKIRVLKKLQIHLTKKCLEVRLENFPLAPQFSWRCAWLSRRYSLPKLILPGLKPPKARSSSPSFGLVAMGQIELALQRGHLASLWGLGLKYVEAVTEMATVVQPDAERLLPSARPREAAFRFTEGKTPFFQGSARAVLEMHLRKKRIQHEWGYPSLAQRSLQAFTGRASQLRRSKAVTQALVLPQELGFLPQKVTNCLEFHLQKMKLQQRWGLPRRVLESCRRLFPGLRYKEKTVLSLKPFAQEPSLGVKTRAGGLVKPRQEEKEARKMWGVGLCPAQPLLRLRMDVLKKLQIHLTKKCLEVRLENFPATPQFSWGCFWLSVSHSLPKLILPGLKPPKARSSCPSFGLVAMGQIELALQRGHLASLWGLGLKYVETLAAMCPGESLSSVKFRKVAFGFSEVKAPFFKNVVKEDLEMHVKQKRLQHEWGYSSLVQKSLGGFIGEAPRHPDLSKTVIQPSLFYPELHFLSEEVRQNLELHSRRMKLQRRWGLPQKVYQSLKLFHTLVPWGKPQAKFGLGETQTDSARWVETNTLSPKNQEALEDLFRCTLETHLKKKSLEIKCQLIGYKTFSGPIKCAFLPKCPFVSSVIRPRTSCLYFVEQNALENINLNIKHKHLIHLWGLPSMYTKSLNKMLGKVTTGNPPLKMSVLRRRALKNSLGQGSQRANAMGPGTKELRFSRKGSSFVQTEALDLLEMHVWHKKLQHEWGLPSMVQKSLQAFAARCLEPEWLSRGFGVAIPGAWGALKVTVKITSSLFFLDPATREHLEAHMKNRTATHRWGLPKRVQESLKMLLPPSSPSQVEGNKGQAEIPLHAYNQVFQTVKKQQSEAENVQHMATVKRALPKGDLLGEMSQEKRSGCGRESQKIALCRETTTPTFFKNEDWDFMGLHVRHKRIHHEWGLPSLVKKSLHAFAPLPPEFQERPLADIALKRVGGGGKASRVTQVPQPRIKVLTPHPFLHFFSQDAKDCLESHVRCWAREHKWGLPQLIQDSLRAMVPPPQVTKETSHHKHHLEFDLQHGDNDSHSKRGGPLQWVSSLKEATEKPVKNIYRRKPDANTCSSFQVAALRSPEVRLLFHMHKSWDLLEFHIIHKKIQHAWGQPSAILKSLCIFAPFPFDLQKHTGKDRAQMGLRDKVDVETMAQQLLFLNTNTREHLETSVRTRTTKHRWEIPKRIQHGFHPCLPPQPSSQSEQAPTRPLWPCQYRCSQNTSHASQISEPLPKAKCNLGTMEIPKRALCVKREGTTEATTFLCPKMEPSFLSVEVQNLLEFHIQQKKIQHMWGLPSTVLKSLHVFAPYLLQPERNTGKTMSRIARRERRDVQILSQEPSFLSIDTKERLEAHLRHLISEHRWDLPKRVQQSLRVFLPSRSPSCPEMTGSQPLLPFPSNYLQKTGADLQTEDIYEQLLHKREPKPKTIEKPKRNVCNKRQKATGRSIQTEAQTSFCTKKSSWNLLEFHIQWKRIQHAWGLPSTVLKSLQIFAPCLLKAEKRTAETMTKIFPRDRGRVQILSQDLHFLSIDIKERLEAHLRHLVAEHRWGLPERVQQLLRAFLPPGSCSRYETAQSQPLVHYQMGGANFQNKKNNEESRQKAKPTWEAMEEPKRRFYYEKTSIHMKMQLSFLPAEVQVLLEFHIQYKKIQHVWGLPHTVLKSLHIYAPCVLKSKKHIGVTVTKMLQQSRGEVHILSQELHFLHIDIKERLEAHLRHLMSEHRWGLPERVQQSLRAFLVPRFPSYPVVARSQAPFSFPSRTFQVTRGHPQIEDHKESLPEMKPRWETMGMQKSKLHHTCERAKSTRETSQGPALQQKHLQISQANLPLDKATHVQLSKDSKGTKDPGILPPSSPSAYSTRKYMPKDLPSFQKVRLASGRTTPRAKNKGPVPCLLKSPKAKMIAWQTEDSSQRTAKQRGSLEGLTQLPRPSLASREQKKSCKILSCPSCHLSAPEKASVSLLKSDRQPKWAGKENEEALGKRGEAVADDSPLLAEDNEPQNSPWSSGDNMEDPSPQEPEAAKTYCRALEADVQPYHTPISQQVSYSSPPHSYVLKSSPSKGNRHSTEHQGVQTSKESKNDSNKNQDSVGTEVELQVHLESCSLTLQTDSKEEGRKENVTFSISTEQSLSSLETMSQGSAECKGVRVDDWDKGGSKWLEMKQGGRNKRAEESSRKEMGSCRCANSSVVRQPSTSAENIAPSLVALSEEERATPSDKKLCSRVAEAASGTPEDHGALKGGEILDHKDVVLWQKRHASVDLAQAAALGQDNKAPNPLTRGTGTISCLPGMHQKAGKKKELRVSWAAQVSHQECLVIRGLVFEPKLSLALKVPRMEQAVGQRSREQRCSGKEKMTILSKILERKLNLQQGLSIWRQSQGEKEKERRRSGSDKKKAGGGQRGRPARPRSISTDKKCSVLSRILKGKLPLWRRLCFWRKSGEKRGGVPKARRTGKSAGM